MQLTARGTWFGAGQEKCEWSRWEASGIDGKGEGPSKRERASQFRDGNDAVTHQLYGNGQYSGGLPYYYLRDHLGSIREMVKSGGTSVASRYDYDPYGRSTTILNTTPSDFTFTGLYGQWLGKRFEGITLHNDIYFRPGVYNPSTPEGIAVLGHELIHVGQFRNGLSIARYIWESRKGYDKNPYERPAYEMQDRIQNTLAKSKCCK